MLAIFLAVAASAGLQNLDALDKRISQFTGAPIGQLGGAIQPVDRRLRLRACGQAPEIDWRDDRRDTLIVRCPDAGGWRLFMPVSVQRPAVPVQSSVPAVVQRGDAVSIAISGQGFSVTRPGEALESGAIGEWIKVRPATNGRNRAEIMRARIVRPGIVSLGTN